MYELLLIHLHCPGRVCPHLLAARCQNCKGLGFHEMCPLSVTPPSVIWHYRSCLMVPITRQTLCHRLLGVDYKSSMMSFGILRENIMIYSAYGCGWWDGGAGGLRLYMGNIEVFTSHVCHHCCEISNLISYSSTQNKNKLFPQCSQFSCALIISEVMHRGLGWEDRRDHVWQNNYGTSITEMYSCQLAQLGSCGAQSLY